MLLQLYILGLNGNFKMALQKSAILILRNWSCFGSVFYFSTYSLKLRSSCKASASLQPSLNVGAPLWYLFIKELSVDYLVAWEEITVSNTIYTPPRIDNY